MKINKFSIIISFLLLLCAITPSFSKNSINSIEFLTNNIGFFCCDNGMIYKTVNSGKSWLKINSATTENLKRIFIVTKNILLITGTTGTILRSQNSGLSWDKIESSVNYNLNGVYVNTDGTGFITGDNKLILQTSDFGLSWAIISEGRPGAINDVAMFGNNNGIMVGDSNFVICTTDGGNSWNYNTTAFHSRTDLKHVRMTDSLTAFATSLTGEIFKTSDGGYSWLLLFHEHYDLALDKITEINKKTIAAVGDRGDMQFSFDYGITWNSQNSGTSEKLLCLYFTDNNTGFCGGENGTLIRTFDGGYSWSSLSSNPFINNRDVVNSVSYKNPELITGNYPNPFNPSTIISYVLQFDANVSLKIYDIDGKEVAKLVNTFQKAGNYHAGFNASGLASGIYFYSLSATDGLNKVEKTMKMILSK